MKTVKHGNLTLLMGTDGGYDYAVFARNGNYAIGIKPLLQVEQSQSVFAFRIRAVHHIEDATVAQGAFGDNGSAIVQGILAAFPGFKFIKVAPERCSTVGTIPVEAGIYQMDTIKDWYSKEQLPAQLIATLKGQLGNVELENEAELAVWLDEVYQGLIAHFESYTKPKAADALGGAVINMADHKKEPKIPAGGHLSDEDLAAEAASLQQEVSDED